MEDSRAKKLRPGEEAEERAQSASGAQGDHDLAAGPSSSAISAVFLQLLPRIASFLPRNEVACVLRLLCKAAAATLRGPQHATVHLSEPAPPAEFQWRWCGPQSLFSTTLRQRQKLEELVARSGVVANLEALAEAHGGDLPLLYRPAAHRGPLLKAAAGAGRLELCRCLHEEWGVPLAADCLNAAAAGGHADVCEWLLAHGRGTWWTALSVCLAFEHGHVQLAERLLQLRPQAKRIAAGRLVQTAARGCDLATLQRVHDEHGASRGVDLTGWQGADCLAAAAASPTPDWAAKVEWLEGLGCPRDGSEACVSAARCEHGAAARLAWLHARGYPLLGSSVLYSAAAAGSAAVLLYVLAQGVQPHETSAVHRLVRDAAASGCVEAVQVLWDAGGRRLDAGAAAAEAAAERGHLHVVLWAAEQLGERAVITPGLFRAAARSGSMPLLRWLHGRGCRMDARTYACAAKSGCDEALEWLVERGCPMGEDGAAYVEAAANQDLSTLRCLARLGCPFAPDGRTFTRAVMLVGWRVGQAGALDSKQQPLQWLLDVGCPVDWDAALQEAKRRTDHKITQWLLEHRQQDLLTRTPGAIVG